MYFDRLSLTGPRSSSPPPPSPSWGRRPGVPSSATASSIPRRKTFLLTLRRPSSSLAEISLSLSEGGTASLRSKLPYERSVNWYFESELCDSATCSTLPEIERTLLGIGSE